MSHHYDRTGERIEDDERHLNRHQGADLCREALARANASRSCPVCGGQLRPGWLIHPSCRQGAS